MPKVSYTPNVWKDKTISFQGSIIDATTMNNIEKGIVDVSNAINDLYVNGPNGIQGPEGPKGDKGETGATGAQGPKGDKGETGATGPVGPQGATGPQGERGPKGDKGETGAQGPQGLPGRDGTAVIGKGGVKPLNTTFFKTINNLADNVEKNINTTIDIVKGLYDIKEVSDEKYYVVDYIDVSHVPTGKMIIVRGQSGGKFLRYDSNKSRIAGAKDNNRVYFKEENVHFIRIGNTTDSEIETEVYALGENAEVFFKDEYDKYAGLLDNEDNIFIKEKAVFGYWFNGSSLSHAFAPNNMFIYGYIDIENKKDIYCCDESATYKTFNIGFYDESYTLLKVVSAVRHYEISKDPSLNIAKYAIISSTNNYPSRDKAQLNNVVLSFKPNINNPKHKLINEEFIDTRKFIKNGWFGSIFDSLGDSLTEAGSFQADIKNKLGLYAFENHGIGGSTMLGNGSKAMWQDERINVLNKNAKLVTIMAGTNDYGAIFNSKTNTIGELSLSNTDVTTYVGAYNTCIKKIFDRYNNDVQILIMTPLFNPSYPVDNFIQIVDACIGIAKMWNLKYIDLYRECGLNNYNANAWWTNEDRIHPKRITYTKKISPVICGEIRTLEPID